MMVVKDSFLGVLLVLVFVFLGLIFFFFFVVGLLGPSPLFLRCRESLGRTMAIPFCYS